MFVRVNKKIDIKEFSTDKKNICSEGARCSIVQIVETNCCATED